MAVMEIFSSAIKLKYKSRICSISSIVVGIFILLIILSPLVLVSNSGGFWLKNRVFFETPAISFEYKYLLIVETEIERKPIVCSTFTVYKENPIEDDCIFFKVQEVDVNSDGKKDFLKFSIEFYSDKPVKFLKLFLFFDFSLKEHFPANIKSLTFMDFSPIGEIQGIEFSGDLELTQKGLLHSSGLYESYNESLDLADFTIYELLAENDKRKFSAKIRNSRIAERNGFQAEKPITIDGKLRYAEIPLNYQPDFWEEMRNAWIQYFSLLAIFAFLSRRALTFLFARRILNSYVVFPSLERCDEK